MKYRLYILLIFSFLANILFAQKAEFIQKGKIEFEKKVNVYAISKQIYQGDPGGWQEEAQDYIKKNNSQFQTSNYVLYFDHQKSLYKSVPSDDNKQGMYFVYNDQDNIAYSDFATESSVRLKHVYEDFFLLNDSCRKINWKLTNETREIAGISCRRANAIIMDSVYVVAFYTDQIVTPGGPDSFNGLPGMILGIALPYDHVTWFATKVSLDASEVDKQITPPTKGKKMNNKEFVEALKPALKNWGKSGQNLLKFAQF